jgi:hypothetical protein
MKPVSMYVSRGELGFVRVGFAVSLHAYQLHDSFEGRSATVHSQRINYHPHRFIVHAA